MKKLKRFFIVLLIALSLFAVYVEVANKNSKSMTYRQKVLKAIYPVLMWLTKLTGKNSKELSGNKEPKLSFYSLKTTLNSGEALDFSTLKGKKVLIVNTASNCGYTNQYEALQELYNNNKNMLVVIGFPANDFKEQEKGTDEEIAQFCKINFGVDFPLAKKSTVIKLAEQADVFKWLTDSTQNGWNDKAPTWNFSKYLVNETGILTNYFDPSVAPDSKEILDAIKK